MLTLIQTDRYNHTFIDTVTYQTHQATEEQVFGVISSKKAKLNGVKLNTKYDGRTNTRLSYTFSSGDIFILNKIDDIGYVICDGNGEISKLDNLTCLTYARLNLIGNADIAKGGVRLKGYYGKVKASDVGLVNTGGLKVESKKYTGSKIDWVSAIKVFRAYYHMYTFRDGKIVEHHGIHAHSYMSSSSNSKNYFALCRDITNGGVRYKVYNMNQAKRVVVPLETIYESYKQYDNVSVDGDTIRISALDGVYQYDMSLIYSTYNSGRIKSKTALKASLIGIDYNESLDTQYRLHRLSSKDESLTIPVSTKHIMAKSIAIGRPNKRLFFPESIETCNINCFDKFSSVYYNIEHIGIATKGEARLQIIKVLSNKLWVLDEKAILEFRGGVTPYEYGYLLMSDLLMDRKCIVQGINREEMTDEFIESLVNSVIDITFDNFNLINRPIEPEVISEYGRIVGINDNREYAKLKKNFKLFKETYSRELAPYATNMLNEKVSRFMGKVDYTINIRDIELKQTIRQLNKI